MTTKYNSHFSFLLLVILSISFNSCYVYQEVILPELEPMLSVSGLAMYGDIDTNNFREDDLFISRIISYANEVEDTITQGTILFTGPNGIDTIPKQPFQTTFGYGYKFDMDWQENQNYTMEVDFPDFPTANCQFKIPVQIQTVESSIEDSIFRNNEIISAFEITIYDPEPNVRNFFSLDLIALHTDPNSGQNSTTQIGWIFEDPLIRTESGYISDEDFVDGKFTFRQETDLSFLPFAPSFWQNWIFEVKSINKETFEYLENLSLHSSAQGNELFASPRPIQGNIEGGEGFFGVVAVQKDTIPWPL